MQQDLRWAMMRVIAVGLATICGLWGQSGRPANELSPQEREQGWRLLFDGQSGKGWHEAGGPGFPASWRVKDGCLEPLAGLAVFQDLVTDESYTNFQLQFRFRLAKGVNGGVKYAIAKFDRWRPKGIPESVSGEHARARGPEFQIVDAVQQEFMEAKQKAGALYGQVAPHPVLALAAGTMHEGRLVKHGTRVEHWLDGTRVLQADLRIGSASGEGATPQPSPIVLQNHANKLPPGEAAACYFDIRILPQP